MGKLRLIFFYYPSGVCLRVDKSAPVGKHSRTCSPPTRPRRVCLRSRWSGRLATSRQASPGHLAASWRVPRAASQHDLALVWCCARRPPWHRRTRSCHGRPPHTATGCGEMARLSCLLEPPVAVLHARRAACVRPWHPHTYALPPSPSRAEPPCAAGQEE